MFGFKRHYLLAGDVFATTEPTEVRTILGSCVSVCLWDHRRSIGGVNHYLAPASLKGDKRFGRYGALAIPRLIKSVLDLGAKRPDLRAKVFGGGKVLDLQCDVGAENFMLACKLLRREGIKVLDWDVGGRNGRGVRFQTHTGISVSKPIRSVMDAFREKTEKAGILPGVRTSP
jgi:chemotaxis receptor (MCP) glutamine deamidase CheD